jgi:hypothetical protein
MASERSAATRAEPVLLTFQRRWNLIFEYWCQIFEWQNKTNSTTLFVICHNIILPSTVIRDLSIWIDTGLMMSPHITKVITSCYAMMHQLHGVWKAMLCESLTCLVIALMPTHLDYCNAVLAGLFNVQLEYLQPDIIFSAHSHDHMTPLLEQLHWPPVHEHIDYKLCMLVNH